MYAIYALPENEKLPEVIEWDGNPPSKGAKVTILQNNKNAKWKSKGNKTTISLPKSLINELLVYSYSI